jgi:hypothetical protein
MAINESILEHVKEIHGIVRQTAKKVSEEYPKLVNLSKQGFINDAISGFNNLLKFSSVYVWENRFEYWSILFSENKHLSEQFNALLKTTRDLKKLLGEVYEYGAARPEFYVKKQIELISPATFNKMDTKLDLVEEMIKKLQK